MAKARKLKNVTYEEMLELASVGSKVLQTRSVSLAMKEGVRGKAFAGPAGRTMRTFARDPEIGEIGIQPEGKAADLDAGPVEGHARHGRLALARGQGLFQGIRRQPPVNHHGDGQGQEQTCGCVEPEAAGIFEHDP